jgi:hypothetical protein
MRLKAIIKNLAVKSHIPSQAVLQNFRLERLLERIALSTFKNQIVIQGGLLIASMVRISSRTTMNNGLEGREQESAQAIETETVIGNPVRPRVAPLRQLECNAIQMLPNKSATAILWTPGWPTLPRNRSPAGSE